MERNAKQHRFLYLLLALVLLMLAAPVARYIHSVAGITAGVITVTVLFAALLVAAVFAVRQRRGAHLAAGALALLVVALQMVNLRIGSDLLLATHHALSICFLAYVIAVILTFLFTTRRVSLDAIHASLCVYLLLGVLWAVVHSLLELLAPGSFAMNSSSGAGEALIRFGGGNTGEALYFSFVTLTTLGYGDIAPVAPMARMFAVIEALTGQLYLVVLVARLVGLHISQGTARSISQEGGSEQP